MSPETLYVFLAMCMNASCSEQAVQVDSVYRWYDRPACEARAEARAVVLQDEYRKQGQAFTGTYNQRVSCKTRTDMENEGV